MFSSADLMLSNLGFSSTPTSSEFNKTPITDRNSLDAAITAWIADDTAATVTYGDINTWDVSGITDFSELFKDKTTFNSDISNWDVSSGTSFVGMFDNARAFNQDIGSWNVSSGNDFQEMFYNAEAFNQDIGSWDVSLL